MEKSQYKLCLEVLKKFKETGILKYLILIGSWCIPFYKDYFSDVQYVTSIRTRDIDFLIPYPAKIVEKVDIANLVKHLGFIVGHKGRQGVMKLEHPDLTIEFLVPEKGRGVDKPYPLPNLGVNAQALRFLNFLTDEVITVEIEDIIITIPHPINYALHKLIVFQRRQNSDKAQRDQASAVRILKAVIAKGEEGIIMQKYKNIPKGWQNKIVAGIKKVEEQEILNLLLD